MCINDIMKNNYNYYYERKKKKKYLNIDNKIINNIKCKTTRKHKNF